VQFDEKTKFNIREKTLVAGEKFEDFKTLFLKMMLKTFSRAFYFSHSEKDECKFFNIKRGTF
jgi:hypothetical protein